MTFNGKSFKAYEIINAEEIGKMSLIMRVLIGIPNWQKPSEARRNVYITQDYVMESYEVIYFGEGSEEDETMVTYERTLEKGVLTEMLALGSIVSIGDVDFYNQYALEDAFPSDTMFFGYDLIKVWGHEEEISSLFRK